MCGVLDIVWGKGTVLGQLEVWNRGKCGIEASL